jgi:flagellar basal-body rod protein FlgF
MSGAMARASQLDAIADNLANVETVGFKGMRPAFAAFMGPGPKSDKVLTATVRTTVDMSPGVTETTDALTDVVPEGDLMLGLSSKGGTVAYTRNGHLEVGPDGVLQIAGLPVIGQGNVPIVVPEGADVLVESTGEVFSGKQVIGKLSLFQVKGPMDRIGPALLTLGAGGSATEVPEGQVAVGELEKGNISALDSAVELIGAQRHYEMAIQAIQTYRQLDQKAVEVGRIR